MVVIKAQVKSISLRQGKRIVSAEYLPTLTPQQYDITQTFDFESDQFALGDVVLISVIRETQSAKAAG